MDINLAFPSSCREHRLADRSLTAAGSRTLASLEVLAADGC